MEPGFQFVKVPAWIWILIWMVIQTILSLLDSTEQKVGVGQVAHVSGFVVGFLCIVPIRSRVIASHPLLYLLHSRERCSLPRRRT